MVLVWIGFSIYHNQTESTVAPNVASQITPITAKFDTKTLEKLRVRKSVAVSLNQNMQLLGTTASSSKASSSSARITPPPSPPQETLLIDENSGSESAQVLPDPAL